MKYSFKIITALKIILLFSFTIVWAENEITEKPAPNKTGPKLVIEEKEFNAMATKQGVALNHTFIVKNEGDQDLKIHDAKGG